jgi:hypothetical protein
MEVEGVNYQPNNILGGNAAMAAGRQQQQWLCQQHHPSGEQEQLVDKQP